MVFLRSFLSHQDASGFVTISTTGELKYEYKINDEHNKILNQIRVQIEKLERRQNDYKPYWTTMQPDIRQMLELDFSRSVEEVFGTQEQKDTPA